MHMIAEDSMFVHVFDHAYVFCQVHFSHTFSSRHGPAHDLDSTNVVQIAGLQDYGLLRGDHAFRGALCNCIMCGCHSSPQALLSRVWLKNKTPDEKGEDVSRK